ncbi:MAG: hypothetical protein NZO16_05640 [Deltaproteobacteria bacterium]|nr:hypothetical protein [Deltaproteobacteria bacterium]
MDDLNDVESWKIAESYVDILDPKPSTLISVLKLLGSEGDDVISSTTRSACERLLLSATFKEACSEFESFYAEILSELGRQRVFDLTPTDLIGILLSVYLNGKMKSIVRAEDLAYIVPRMFVELDLACCISLCLPGLNLTDGVLFSMGKFFGLCLSYVKDQKFYTEYRRYLRANNFRFDKSFEFQRLGCSLEQISSVALLNLGLNSSQLDGYSTYVFAESTPPKVDCEYKFWILSLWINSLIKDKNIPNIEHKLDFYPPTELVDKFTSLARKILDSHQGVSMWLDKA